MLIKNIVPYEAVDGKFVVRFKKPVQKYAKGYSFQLRLGDPSGEVMARYWGSDNKDEIERLYNSVKKDGVVYVAGESTLYNDNLVININPPLGKLALYAFDEAAVIPYLLQVALLHPFEELQQLAGFD